MQHLQKGHSTKINLRYLKEHQEAWAGGYNNARSGLSLQYLDMGNPQELGSAIAINYVFSCNLNKGANPLSLLVGGGPALLSKRFDTENNSKNIAIGSRLNASLLIEMEKKWGIGEHLIGLGLGINHFSNAAFKAPNLGVNIPTITLGFYPHQNRISNSTNEKLSLTPGYWVIVLDAGAKEQPTAGGPKFFNGSLELRRTFKSSSNHFFEALVYGSINTSIKSSYENSTNIITGEQLEMPSNPNLQYGPAIGYRISFGTSQLFLQQGYYLKSEQLGVGNLFHRLGFSQFIGKNLVLGLVLKSHFAKAEYLGLSLGYKWRKNDN